MILKIIKFISALPTSMIPRISQFILLFSYIVMMISGIRALTGRLTTLQLLFIICVVGFLGVSFLNIIYLSVYYLLYENINLDKWFEICNRINKSSSLAKIYVSAQLNYYRGDFETNINALIPKIQRVLNAENAFNKFMLLSILYKCGIMTGDEKLIEKSRLELEKNNSRNKRKQKWKEGQLSFCNMMHDIVVLKEVNDAINTWTPQYPGGKINVLERTYFQALNEQLKGNTAQAQEYYEQLSKENEDLYFVKEAKKYMDSLS